MLTWSRAPALARNSRRWIFFTARAKIYPSGMNASIATAVSRFLADRDIHAHYDQLPHDLQEINSTEFVEGSVIQPDFHG